MASFNGERVLIVLDYNCLLVDSKRARGQYYTKGNPFCLSPFQDWARRANLSNSCVLEPFAGANHIIYSLQDIGLCGDFSSYDLLPADSSVKELDTICDFPEGYDVCVTNPPWLARNSATRRRLPYPETKYDDLYKHCLDLCLMNCRYVAALTPASFLQSGLFQERLSDCVLLNEVIFSDTENPVCLALFDEDSTEQTSIWNNNYQIGSLQDLLARLPIEKKDRKARFNDPLGELGFIAFDDTKEPSIRFCSAEEISDYSIKSSSRFITRISGDFEENVYMLAKRLNDEIAKFRRSTADVFLTPFKGMRKDNVYRRRMSFGLARRFINAA